MAENKTVKLKPRVGFCWYCGNKLRGNHFAEVEIDGHLRILHKACAKENRDRGNLILNRVNERLERLILDLGQEETS